MATTKTKRINWLFPDPDVEMTLEDYRNKIREDERSGDLSVSEFKRRLESWMAENIPIRVISIVHQAISPKKLSKIK